MHLNLETNHGSYRVAARPGDTIADVLAALGVPGSAIWTYTVESRAQPSGVSNAREVQFVSSNEAVEDLERAGKEVFARVTRNINIPGLLGLETRGIREVDRPSTEWVFPDEAEGAFRRTLCQLTPDECFQLVRRSVDEVLHNARAGDESIVVGTSGGGDSNVLLSAMLESGHIAQTSIVPVIMLGIPDWDTQLDNARELCSSMGLSLRVIEPDDAAGYAGVDSFEHMTSVFKQRYPDADLEFLGTWLLRKVLGGYARSINSRFVATGANREDVVAEGLARISRGLLPLPAPVRTIGDTTFLFPMWKVPKKIGDGAYVTYSLENYEHRNPSFSRGRSVFYYLAYWLPELTPGIDLDFLQGFSRLASIDEMPFSYDPELGDYVCREGATESQRDDWKAFLSAVS